MESGIQNTPDFSSILNGLLSNPSALSSLVSVLGSVTNGQSKSPPTQVEDTPVFSHTDSATVPDIPALKLQDSHGIHPFPPPKGPVYANNSREKTLLLAIKPFLSKNKCDTLDIFIKLLDIISLVGRIK